MGYVNEALESNLKSILYRANDLLLNQSLIKRPLRVTVIHSFTLNFVLSDVYLISRQCV